ncbi:MAG: dual specificity protein phosphatase family protein [Oceanococcus sp.]
MKSYYDAIFDRFLALLGVDIDLPLELHGERFSKITETLFLGARPSIEHCEMLKETGITHVVSVLSENDQSKMAFLQPEFESLFLGIHDRVNQEISAIFPDFFEFSFEALQSHSRAKILIHCEAGVSRSATLAIALLMKSEHKAFFEAFSQVQAKRPQILPNIGFASQLQQLEMELLPCSPNESEDDSLTRFLHEICNVPVEHEVIQSALTRHNYDAVKALHSIFGPELPRVIQGIRF